MELVKIATRRGCEKLTNPLSPLCTNHCACVHVGEVYKKGD